MKDISLFAKSNANKDGTKNYCKKCHSSYMVKYVQNNPTKKTKDNPERKFKRHGLTSEKYLTLISLHDGKCHTCRDRKATNIDHDHSCCPGSYSCGNCVRGILCNQCNTALGLLQDDLQKISNLIEYLSINK